jgi:hypothetical protein
MIAIGLGEIGFAQGVRATATYEYTGNPFVQATPPYTTSDFVSGSLTFTSARGPNQVVDTVGGIPRLVAFSFTDGVQTLTSANASVGIGFVDTNGAGEISDWGFSVNSLAANGSIETADDFATTTIVDEGSTTFAGGQVFGNPGIWTLVPEPSTFTLSALGLSLLATAMRRKQA